MEPEELENALDALARYASKEELDDLPGELPSVLKQLKGIADTGGMYEIVAEETEEGYRVTVYTLRRSRRLGTSRYPGWERTKKIAELEIDEDALEAVSELFETVRERVASSS